MKRCTVTGKRKHRTKIESDLGRAYLCQHCGYWHLARKQPRSKAA